MKIAIIGAGGIGSHLIHMLVNTIGPDDSITVFDGDKFEERNLERQLFGKDMIAENKASAMFMMYNTLADIKAEDRFVLSPDEIKDFDLVFCVPDNNTARRVAIDAFDEYGVEIIIAGNENVSANALIYNSRIGSVNRGVHPYEVHPEYLLDSPPENSCSANVHKNPQSIVANSIAASLCMALFTCWRDGSDCYTDDVMASSLPIEYEWGRTFMKKHTIDSVASVI